jgi:hypothetical protein
LGTPLHARWCFNAFGECASIASCDTACSEREESAWSYERWLARRGRGTGVGVPHGKRVNEKLTLATAHSVIAIARDLPCAHGDRCCEYSTAERRWLQSTAESRIGPPFMLSTAVCSRRHRQTTCRGRAYPAGSRVHCRLRTRLVRACALAVAEAYRRSHDASSGTSFPPPYLWGTPCVPGGHHLLRTQ